VRAEVEIPTDYKIVVKDGDSVKRGSELFEAITCLPEYYPTRTETALLTRHAENVAALAGKAGSVVEFGSGSSAKTPILLRALDPSVYVPIDISGDFLRASADAIQERFPTISVHPVEADFMQPIALPSAIETLPKLGFFPGSTIGNLVPRTAVDLLRAMKETLGSGAWLLIGMDRIKEIDVLMAAYDDAAGVTASFNLNLLHRINAELDADIPVEAFRHRAIWNDAMSRIEMHLEAVRDVAFAVSGRAFSFRAGDTIHTPPGEWHWHGAAPSTAMSHIAVQESLDGSAVQWMEHVSDAVYGAGMVSDEPGSPGSGNPAE
jgi:L-histidine Nalpha-methyltransferase